MPPSEPEAESRGNRPTARSSLRRARELTATGRNEHRTLPAASLLMDPLKKLGAWGHHVAATFCFAVPLEVRQGAAGTASDQATGRPCGPMQQSCAQRARPSDGDRACVTSECTSAGCARSAAPVTGVQRLVRSKLPVRVQSLSERRGAAPTDRPSRGTSDRTSGDCRGRLSAVGGKYFAMSRGSGMTQKHARPATAEWRSPCCQRAWATVRMALRRSRS